MIFWGLTLSIHLWAQELRTWDQLSLYNNPLDRQATFTTFNKGIESASPELAACEERIHYSTQKIKHDFVAKIVASERSREIINGFSPVLFTEEEQNVLLLTASELEKSCAPFALDFVYDEVRNRSYFGLLDTINAYKRYFEEAPELLSAYHRSANEQNYGASSLDEVAVQYPNSVIFLDTGIDPATAKNANISNILLPIQGLALDGENHSDKYWSLVDHGAKVIKSYDATIKELEAKNPSLTVKNQLIPVSFFSFYDFFDRLYFDTPSPTYMRYTSDTLNQLLAAKVRIVNFSGALDRDAQEFYQLFERYPDTIWIVAAGNQGVNIDDPENQKAYPLRPQVYRNREGKRFENIINVTISQYDAQENKSYISENYGSAFVDIAVEGRIRGTSFAAPIVTACVVALLEKSGRPLSAKEIKAHLVPPTARRASVSGEESVSVPILDCQKSLETL